MTRTENRIENVGCNLLAKPASDRLPAPSIAIWLSVGYIPVMVLVLLAVGWPRKFEKCSVAHSAMAGLLNQLAALAFYVALTTGLVSIVSVVSSLYPVITIRLAVTCLRERINPRRSIGVLLALVSIALLSV